MELIDKLLHPYTLSARNKSATHWRGGWMGLSACLDDMWKREIYFPVTTLTWLPKFLSFKKRQINYTRRK